MTVRLVLTLLASIGLPLLCCSQDSQLGLEKIVEFPANFVGNVNSRITTLEASFHKQRIRYLARLKKREARLMRKLAARDSLAAAALFADAEQKYAELQRRLATPQKYKEYIPYLDTLSMSLQFLEQQKVFSNINTKSPQQLKDALSSIKGLESQLQNAEAIKQFLGTRKLFLKDKLVKYGLGRELKRLNKDVYYYNQYINEYKSLIQSPEKLERKAIELLSKTSVFQDFLKKNSLLASIFRIPNDQGISASQANFSGLQTNTQVTQMVQQQFGSAGFTSNQVIHQNIQHARNQLQQLKDKIANFGTTESREMPSFKPNTQKTKTFLQRLEVGTNFQTQKANYYFPAQSDIGFSLGYKLNDKSIVGLGMAYSISLGSGWREIKLSGRGVGIRSFIDWRLKRSFWLSGGYEMNYSSEFHNVDQLKHLSAWQPSGLIGLSKIVSLKTKVLKKTKMSLLWDFLSYSQTPETKAIKLRIGYNF